MQNSNVFVIAIAISMAIMADGNRKYNKVCNDCITIFYGVVDDVVKYGLMELVTYLARAFERSSANSTNRYSSVAVKDR